jgi:hypothetical protein
MAPKKVVLLSNCKTSKSSVVKECQPKSCEKMRFNQLGRKPDRSSSCRLGSNAKREEMLVTLSNPSTWDTVGSVSRRRRNCATYVASTPVGNENEKIAKIHNESGSSCFC